MEVDGDTVTGHVTFGRAYQGPPGQVHGGVIAGVYDQVLGLANFVVGRPGFTGTLSVRYVAPTRSASRCASKRARSAPSAASCSPTAAASTATPSSARPRASSSPASTPRF